MNDRKKLLTEWKAHPPVSGVYEIATKSGGSFLGRSRNLTAIRNRHWFQLELGTHPEKALQTAWNAEGEAGFRFIIVSELEVSAADDEKQRVEDLETLWELTLNDLRTKRPKDQFFVLAR